MVWYRSLLLSLYLPTISYVIDFLLDLIGSAERFQIVWCLPDLLDEVGVVKFRVGEYPDQGELQVL